MKRLSGLVLPAVLALVGVALIVVGQLQLDEPGPSLPPIDGSAVAVASETPDASASQGATDEPTPSPTPIPDDWVAVQIEVPSVELNVAVKHAKQGDGSALPTDAAYILYQSSEPGRNANTYLVAHALQNLFKRLWNVMLGAEVKILMSDGAVLRYVVTEVHANVSCPDDRAAPMPNPPLALQYALPGCPGAAWINATDHERLTLQTSQGFNRNWGELVVVAEPVS
ncbi:MAG: sortase [Chloroflexota bacterium]|nr:sortase [Chloroflexota bacterium]